MKNSFFSLCCVLFFSFFFMAKSPASETNVVQLAILLDTSGSMEGLIEQAKTQLWKIVNELARSQKDGQPIELNVALYEYGKDDIPASENYLRMISPFTDDLDKISQELFKLRTNGGEEYCGTVIASAVKSLKWNKNNDDLKIIFIAGNEPFTQGSVDYKRSCKEAITKGIIINTIFCGTYEEGVQTNWKEGADLADGKYMNLDQNSEIVHIPAPQDDELIKLGEELNTTYLGYGASGNEMKMRQMEQDANSQSLGAPVVVERSITKAGNQYQNASWDLLDAVKEGTVDITKMKKEDLPKELQNKSTEEQKKIISEMQKKREKIQTKMNKLSEERRKYIAEKSVGSKNTLDELMLGAIREQAKTKNYKFD